MKIRKAERGDAEFLAEVVMEAVGHELCVGLAGDEKRVPLVHRLFTRLASLPESQYSYENAYVALSDSGERLGGIIAYDGSRLQPLRNAFIKEANNILGWDVTEEEAEEWGDEADPDEIYIDSLYVVPSARKRGIASRLLNEVKENYRNSGKPIGLLVEPDNQTAIETYRHWGFQKVGISDFFQTPMIHMQLQN